MQQKILTLLLLLTAVKNGDAVTCYHCYDSYNDTISLGSSDSIDSGSIFIRCDKNIFNWNSWECPTKWPVCIIMSAKVQNHLEIIRSCAERDFCSGYVPPVGVKLQSCRECETHLCNDHLVLPTPPDEPTFTFNINLNLNLTVNKHVLLDDKN